MRKNISALLFFIVLFLCSCSVQQENSEKEYRFAFIYYDSMDNWEDIDRGTQKATDEFCKLHSDVLIKLISVTAESVIDQEEKLNECLLEKYDGIVIMMPDMVATYPVMSEEQWAEADEKRKADIISLATLSKIIKGAFDSGVPVLTIGNDQYCYSASPSNADYWGDDIYMEQPSRMCFIGSDNYSLGRSVAEKAIELQNGNAKIYLFGGWRHSTEQLYRRQGVKEVVSENAEAGNELVAGSISQDSHLYPFDEHVLALNDEGVMDIGQSCLCEDFLRQEINLVERGRVQLNTYIGLWEGSNAISNVFREKGWDDADTNKEHLSILCGESPETITALKEHFATCIFLEDRYEWGFQAAKTLIEIVCQGKMPESDHIYTPSYIVDLSEVYDYYPDSK